MINFEIAKGRSISNLFLQIGLTDFDAACAYIANLPYRPNSNESNLIMVLEERCGTSSTKHAILRKLCVENEQRSIHLTSALFRMDAAYKPAIQEILEKHGLDYIPALHYYLTYQQEHYDYSRIGSDYSDIKDRLIEETTIEYHQIDEYQKAYLLSYYAHWIQTAQLPFTVLELWEIMEACNQA